MKLHCTLRSFLSCFLFCVSCVAVRTPPRNIVDKKASKVRTFHEHHTEGF